MNKPADSTRAYDSPLRAQQVEQTRDKILEAFSEELAEAREEFSIPQVAKRAGVSTRTVYHHFPNRESQVEALADWIEKRVGPVEKYPATPEELSECCEKMNGRFAKHESLLRAQLAAGGMAKQVRARRRRGFTAAIDQCVKLTGASDQDARVVAALFKHLMGAPTAIALMDEQGLNREELNQILKWSVGLMVKSLQKGSGPYNVQNNRQEKP